MITSSTNPVRTWIEPTFIFLNPNSNRFSPSSGHFCVYKRSLTTDDASAKYDVARSTGSVISALTRALGANRKNPIAIPRNTVEFRSLTSCTRISCKDPMILSATKK